MTMAPWMRGDPNQTRYSFGDALRQFGGALEGLQQNSGITSPEHMQKVFAANPEFAAKLYGALNSQAATDATLQNTALEREALLDKQRRLEALRQLAPNLAGLNLKDPATRQSALAQYGAITGDLDPMFGLGQDQPASLQEWSAFSSMDPATQAKYLQMKRANQIVNLGGTQAVVDPTGGIQQEFPVTLKPEDVPQNAADKAAAVEEAKLRQQLELDPQITAANKRAELQEVAAADLVKKAKSAENTINILDKAAQLLPKATGSGVGAARDVGKKFLGMSDEQTQANAELETLSGWLVANVPRMEGPQSNFDVQNYKTMAADVGNPNIPVADRLAKLRGLRDLQSKYAEYNIEITGDSSLPSGRKRYNPATGKLE